MYHFGVLVDNATVTNETKYGMTKIDDSQHILGRLMARAGRAFRQRLETNLSLSNYDLRAEQMILLRQIQEHEGANQQVITECMSRDKASITRWIDQLEEKKLVVRVSDQGDRRQKRIHLTDEGKKLIPCFLTVAFKTESEALAGVDPEHVKICKDVLDRVRRNLEG